MFPTEAQKRHKEEIVAWLTAYAEREGLTMSELTFISRVIPSGIGFCSVMMSTNKTNMIPKVLPPCLSTFKSLWKPTLVKKASIKISRSVPSNDTSICPHPYSAKVSSEKMIPPLTGDGIQNRCRKATLRVRTIPTISAKAPIPVV